MATTEGPARAHDRNGRRRPFSSWMKRLANLKSSSSDSNNVRWSNKRHATPKDKKSQRVNNNPYPLSGTTTTAGDYRNDLADSHRESSDRSGLQSGSHSEPSIAGSGYDNHTKSTAPTISTNGDTALSEAAYSKAGTLATAGGGFGSTGGGEGSTFSSPAPSVRSLTTTLTTVQSAAPSTHLYNAQNAHHGHSQANSSQGTAANQQVQFSHPFPPSSPATAVPPHLVPHGQSVTYNTATANNLLTDNASILTLASSSKRRRRNSLDTNASVRALAPSSIFGGSRESLPLSVLSSNVGETSNASAFNPPGVHNRPSLVGLASAERISVYSNSGAGALSSGGERGSLYAGNKQSSGAAGDGASIKSAGQSHSRNDSNAASISGGVGSPLVGSSINQPMATGRISRRSSGWGEITGDESEDDKPMEKKDDEKIEIRNEDIATEQANDKISTS